jgi:hypothetical protein
VILTSLLTWKVKAIAAVAVVGGAVWWHQHALAVVYSEAAQETTEKVLKEQAGEVDRKVKEALDGYAQERADLDAQRGALVSERVALSGQRRAISEAISKGFGEIAVKGSTFETEIRNVPADALDGRIRAALGRARTADAELARLRATH